MVCVVRLAVNRTRFESFVVGRRVFDIGVIKVEECFQDIFPSKNAVHVDAGLIGVRCSNLFSLQGGVNACIARKFCRACAESDLVHQDGLHDTCQNLQWIEPKNGITNE